MGNLGKYPVITFNVAFDTIVLAAPIILRQRCQLAGEMRGGAFVYFHCSINDSEQRSVVVIVVHDVQAEFFYYYCNISNYITLHVMRIFCSIEDRR